MLQTITSFILSALENARSNGHSFLLRESLEIRLSNKFDLDLWDSVKILAQAVAGGVVVETDGRIFLPIIYRAEMDVAAFVADALSRSPRAVLPSENVLTFGGLFLNKEQRHAVAMALNNRLSMIVGSAGTGKSTIVRFLLQGSEDPNACLLCSPTAKAAYILTQSTGVHAATIHSALGVPMNGDLTSPNRDLSQYRMVIIDEASMLTIDMLAGIVSGVSDDCKIVLVGDSQQLMPIGCGNLLADLLELGVPFVALNTIYRQSARESGLFNNVTRFHTIKSFDEFRTDHSFEFIPSPDPVIAGLVVELASSLRRGNESTVILSPYANHVDISSNSLNQSMQAAMHSVQGPVLDTGCNRLYEHDPVLFTRNNRKENYFNGQTGTLELAYDQWGDRIWSVRCPSGVIPVTENSRHDMAPAYALSVHKAQGSAFDNVIMPVSLQFSNMLTRNMLYTALSRARKHVFLIGDPDAIDYALAHPAPERKTVLVEMVNQKLMKLAS